MLSKLKSLPSFGAVASWPGVADLSAMDPMQFYMQFVGQWQKACSDAMAFWMKTAALQGGGLQRH